MCFKKKGMTLIELMVAISVFSLLLTIVSTALLFSLKTIANGQQQASIQSSVRLASQYVTNYVRTAESVEILDALPDTLQEDTVYIAIKDNTLKLIKKDSQDLDIFNFNEEGLGNPVVTFNKGLAGDKSLMFSIGYNYKGKNYSIQSEIALINMNSSSKIGGISYGCVLQIYGTKYYDTNVEELTEDEKMVLEAKNRFDFQTSVSNIIKDLNGDYVCTLSNNGNIVLPQVSSYNPDVKINWKSSDPNVISNTGEVTVSPTTDKTVYLTASFYNSSNTATCTTQFKVRVPSNSPIYVENINEIPIEVKYGTLKSISLIIKGSSNYTIIIDDAPGFIRLESEAIMINPTAADVGNIYMYTLIIKDNDSDNKRIYCPLLKVTNY